jgi:hypothetical protein
MQSTGLLRRLAAIALLAAPLVVQRTPAHAADLAGLASQITRAIDATAADRMVMDWGANGTTTHMELVAVRRGVHPGTYIKMTVKTPTATQVIEGLMTTTQICYRLQQAWRCTPVQGGGNPSFLYALYNNPIQAVALASHANAAAVRTVPLGDKTLRGQLCAGYELSAADPSAAKETGKIWINVATSLPVQLDARDLGKQAMTLTAVWSNWNDPSLRLPASPAS